MGLSLMAVHILCTSFPLWALPLGGPAASDQQHGRPNHVDMASHSLPRPHNVNTHTVESSTSDTKPLCHT